MRTTPSTATNRLLLWYVSKSSFPIQPAFSHTFASPSVLLSRLQLITGGVYRRLVKLNALETL